MNIKPAPVSPPLVIPELFLQPLEEAQSRREMKKKSEAEKLPFQTPLLLLMS